MFYRHGVSKYSMKTKPRFKVTLEKEIIWDGRWKIRLTQHIKESNTLQKCKCKFSRHPESAK